ncbi:multidrug effflux MFS transporter [Bacillus sp. B15-48]|uniref:multidrug effflux MFS transporter n=1 Tax=Bacillus sp. B15-48 TaxID=1548601 RepID=UPI00193F2DFF|nr:multidrug effflux MFS transporter [Bacillus sp. B15-48]MBM4763335.1 Bcr/CflA family efflux MFS transporter [Bacillus sp. B15-48]
MNLGRRLWMTALLGSLAAFSPMTMDMYLPAFPMIAESYQTNASFVQLSLTATLLGLAGGQLFFGPLSDSIGRKKPLLIALIIYITSSIICIFAPNIFYFILTRFIQGLAVSACAVISRTIVRDMYSGNELTKFFAMLMLVNGLAPILAPILGAFVIEHSTWYTIFLVLGLIGAVMFFLVISTLPETLSLENRRSFGLKNTISTFSELLKDKMFLGYALTQSLMMAAVFAYISGTPFVYQGVYGVSPQMFSLLFALNAVGIIIGTQITGWLAGKIPETTILYVGMWIPTSASILLFIMILLKAPLIFIVIPLCIVTSAYGMTNTCSFSLAMRTQGHRSGSAAALLGLLPFLLAAISAPLVGIGGGATAVPMGLTILIMTIGAHCSYMFLTRRQEQIQIDKTGSTYNT